MSNPSRWVRATLFLPMVSLAACMQGSPDDDGLPGDSLGTYQVQASLKGSTCGAGAFGAPDAWDFQVKLAREGAVLYWNNGSELVSGKMGDDGKAFSFSAQMTVPVTERKGAQAGCVILREDSATGVLSSATPDEVTGFSGELGYGYAQQAGSDCSVVLEQAGATGFPCAIQYSLTATRAD